LKSKHPETQIPYEVSNTDLAGFLDRRQQTENLNESEIDLGKFCINTTELPRLGSISQSNLIDNAVNLEDAENLINWARVSGYHIKRIGKKTMKRQQKFKCLLCPRLTLGDERSFANKQTLTRHYCAHLGVVVIATN
jgi:hypothetical protein